MAPLYCEDWGAAESANSVDSHVLACEIVVADKPEVTAMSVLLSAVPSCRVCEDVEVMTSQIAMVSASEKGSFFAGLSGSRFAFL